MKYCIFLSAILFSVAGYGNIYNVTDVTDGNNPNQLRGAVLAANAAGPGPHTINIAAGSYTLTMGQIITGNSAITINFQGAGAASTIINMTTGPGSQNRFFMINPPGTVANVHISFTGIRFTGGRLTSDNFGGGAVLGGGPNNTLTFTDCAFDANTIDAALGGGNGAAISFQGGGTLLISQCTFSNNSNPDGGGGAIYYSLPASQSGQLSVMNSVFSSNSATASNSDGGAILINVATAVSATTSIIAIQRNVFTGNSANQTGGVGGAIAITNAFNASNVASINFNRFVGNTANNAATSGVGMFVSGAGSVDVTNNWWGCNGGPISGTGCNRAGTIASGGTGVLTATNWLQLKTSASASTICNGSTGNSTGITASFLQNSDGQNIAPSILSALVGTPISFTPALGTISGAQTTIQSNGTATATFTSNGTAGTATINSVADNVPTNDLVARASVTVNPSPVINTNPQSLVRCPGNEATFTVTASGSSLTYAWFKGPFPLADGQTASGSEISGAATSTLAIRHTGILDNSTAYNVQVTQNGCMSQSGNAQLTVPPLSITNANETNVRNISGNDFAINAGSCSRIVRVQPFGMAPVNGTVTASVTIDGGQPSYNGQPYVSRHYDINPASNANTATAIVTLYFLQSEFDSYNAATPGTTGDLPTDPNDATGRNNLRVTQFHGTGTSPGNYTGWTGAGPGRVLIVPGGSSVVWNNSGGWWEVTFPVTGFSGFYITGLANDPLPVTLLTITATQREQGIEVQWQVEREVTFSHYEVEASADGSSFATIGSVPGTGNASYSFIHQNPVSGINYYRLKMVDRNGQYTHSRTVTCQFSVTNYNILVISNPFRQQLQVRIDAIEATVMNVELLDLAGKRLLKKSIAVSGGRNTFRVPASRAVNGTYLLRISNDHFVKVIKVVKNE